ncbi:D-serine deaminase-like pyridoxal phosphate-dependent protein [Bradyrhizobium elkanii]|jgi:D-serine deaminase-like pyridoxal phosphate-dependent protein|uniref:alanine racemase n=1 Tax=Bradyrhizobium TaxID=374 RepID=UPI0003608E5D|nr:MULTISPECIES: alanine racemase [Bradyrhizobium]MCP1730509.1 D-serine deaminase-like pyridoxal phosphate-dependent protein [Bradyrhizobium elkanii]MCP1930972.1 D-serine deaminase-like pyridoxal phosphate-dependent protein [Bradyrhizobium elkanii]MCS3480810.1 D-serine deaminase-like pyridoxal phosphate-dependent protein [Bradyrhizobium elkanii]MCS3517618.1 D-serine deaminase-like pyridoxal phosphate-dependent protein [Bradyrhizobium elkanii]MCS3574638.1 D-serine deaminase-like pyridoxal phosp
MTTPLAAKIAKEYGTPCAVIDMDRVERNIARIQKACDEAGVANRPHIKTHKNPMLAQLQIKAGAKGVTCQKLGEAEIMADAGIDNILISYNLLGDEKMARLGALQGKANVTVAADNSVVVGDLPKAAAASGRPLTVVVECDTGRKRAGVETPAEAIALAREIAASKGLAFAGFMLYPTETGWADAQKFYDEALAGVRAYGLDATIVSTGGTPNLKNLGKLKGGTEHRFGTYIYNDRMQVAAGVATWDDCALHVYSTVVSRAGPERGILDAGSKTLTSDTGGLEGHGLILEHPEARIARFAEEHGFLDLSRSNTRPNVGDVVRVVPNHVCVVVNMMDEVVMVRGDEIIGALPVTARGKLR